MAKFFFLSPLLTKCAECFNAGRVSLTWYEEQETATSSEHIRCYRQHCSVRELLVVQTFKELVT